MTLQILRRHSPGWPVAAARRLGVALSLLALPGCGGMLPLDLVERRDSYAEIMPRLAITERLESLPAPAQQFTVAIYDFRDQTGQRRPNPNVAEMSTAVTQGGTAILVNAAFHAGDGTWFRVLERGGLDNLLQERQIIRATREQFGVEEPLNPLTFGGMLLEGGIISYDTNVMTGGAGARLLGVGAHSEYQVDSVSVYLRASSVNTGEIVESVQVTKTLLSTRLQGNVFRYIEVEELLEVDAGVTTNEPTQVAVRQAIEASVYALIMEGVKNGLWSFADQHAGAAALAEYDALLNAQSPAEESEEEEMASLTGAW